MPHTDTTYNPHSTHGNLAQQTIYSVNNNVPAYQNMRALFWDEDDRLNLVAGDGYLSYYAYGYDGNRAIKMTGNAAIDQSGTLLNSTNLENITIYPNEYLTVTQAEYTKYYYAGGNRIASKIGTGGFGKMTKLCTEDLFCSGNANTLFGSVLLQVTNTANQPTDVYPVDVCAGYNVSNELLHSPLPDFYISQTNLNFAQNNLLQQFRQNLAGGTEPIYYFHSDHLGSASWITSGTGLPAQHLLYLPFGEHFANEHSSNYDERFTFTGKERDAETGYYYHGARFNSSDLDWLSVDPMSDKYPSISPYAYCAWNPVKLVDPDGREVEIIGEDGTKPQYTQGIRYEGNDKFTKKAINTLNHIYSSKNGSIVLKNLVESKETFTITNELNSRGNRSFTLNESGGGIIKIGTLNEEQKINIFNLSHELFHGFQHNNNQGGKSIYNEVEAYLFAFSVINSVSGSGYQNVLSDGNSKKDYNDAVEKLLYNEFSETDFNIVLQGFKKNAPENQKGTYNDYPLRRTNQTKHLIQTFYPLYN